MAGPTQWSYDAAKYDDYRIPPYSTDEPTMYDVSCTPTRCRAVGVYDGDALNPRSGQINKIKLAG